MTTSPSERLEPFTINELSILRECVSMWRMEDLGLGDTTKKLEKEISEELEKRVGIIHGN